MTVNELLGTIGLDLLRSTGIATIGVAVTTSATTVAEWLTFAASRGAISQTESGPAA